MHQIDQESETITPDDDSLYTYVKNDIEYRLFEDIVDSYYLCYIVGLGLNCKFIDLLFKRSFNIFIKISLYLNFIVLEIVSKQTDTLIQELMYLR